MKAKASLNKALKEYFLTDDEVKFLKQIIKKDVDPDDFYVEYGIRLNNKTVDAIVYDDGNDFLEIEYTPELAGALNLLYGVEL